MTNNSALKGIKAMKLIQNDNGQGLMNLCQIRLQRILSPQENITIAGVKEQGT